MKKITKIITLIILTIITTIIPQVYAESNLVISRKSYIYTEDRTEAKFYTNKGYAYCITPQSVGPDQGTTLRYKNDMNSGGLLYLLENAGTSDSEYLATQLAIWQYDGNYMPDFYKNRSNYSVVQRAKSLAIEASRHSNYQGKNPTINIATSNSSFTETTDGKYYKSGMITVNSNNVSSIDISLLSAPSGTQIVNTNNQTITKISANERFYVIVPVNSVYTVSTINIKATATGTVSKIERYTTGNSHWQELIVLTKGQKTTTATARLSVSPIKRYCEYTNGKYYGKSGNVVTKEQYSIECEKHTCEKVGNTYFGKSGNVITKEQYSIECEKHTCERVGNTYFGTNGNVVTKEQYSIECEKHTCEKVGNTYFGKDGSQVSYSEYSIQCEKHTCEFINGKFFGIQGFEVTKEQYIKECMHTCEIYNNQYYGPNGEVVTEAEYKKHCEMQVVPVPDTGSMGGFISILIGSSILGSVIGILSHNNKRKKA